MCFDDGETYTSKTYIRNGQQYYYESPGYRSSWRRRLGLGGSYYPSRYYARPPASRYVSGARVGLGQYPRGVLPGGYARGVVPGGYSQALVPAGYTRGMVHGSYPRGVMPGGYANGGQYLHGARAIVPGGVAMPRHQYIYTPRYGQRGFHSYAGQLPNGAYPAGVMPGGYGYGIGVGYVGMGAGVGVVAGGYHPAVYNTMPTYPYSYSTNYSSIYNYPAYGGYYNHGLYGSTYPFANLCYPYQRTYYNTTPGYGYPAHVYPPGATTTTTTYHVTNSHAQSPYVASPVVRTACTQTPAREDIQMENRRVATERGAYAPRRIRPADARHDDPFWCRERNGEWHLRTFYQIENECHPGRWLMDAEVGFLVFHRE